MASLRKRLARGDIETSESGNNGLSQSFVLFGTPLPPLFGKPDPNEGKPVWEQEFRDEQGRRRFHGAFTGGWSAGYYNTVGSKEGWQPQAFVSSRRDKKAHSSKKQLPEDYMDEEDLAELEFSRRLNNHSEYQTVVASGSHETVRHADDEVLGDLLGLGKRRRQDLYQQDAAASALVAPPSSIGHKILTRMGWKPGSGLGPLVTAERRLRLARFCGSKILSEVALNAQSSGRRGRLAPPDTPLPALEEGYRKKDVRGLGWPKANGEPTPRSALQSSVPLEMAGKTEIGISALDSVNEDDVVDVFKPEPGVHDRLVRALRNSVTDVRPQQLTSGALHREPLWRDGRKLPEGFVVIDEHSIVDANKERTEVGWHAPPRVPEGWKPDPFRIWGTTKIKASAPLPLPSKAARNQQTTNATDRAQLLDEAPVPEPPLNLPNYIPAARTAREDEPQFVPVPSLSEDAARAALQGFLPFVDDNAKQRRYLAFLNLCAEASITQKRFEIPYGRQRREVEAELNEFFQSANIFKPMGSAMANRFTSAQTQEGKGDSHAPTPGLYQPIARSREELEAEARDRHTKDEERISKEKEERKTDKQKAAKAGLFGPSTTRTVQVWHPARLLCKRFSVPDPYPDLSTAVPRNGLGLKERLEDDPFHSKAKQETFERSAARREIRRGEERWAQSQKELMGAMVQRGWAGQKTHPSSASSRSEANLQHAVNGQGCAANSLESVGLGEIYEAQLQEIESLVKPARSVFKSVFEDEDEDEDQNENENENENENRDRDGEKDKGKGKQAMDPSMSRSTLSSSEPKILQRVRNEKIDDAAVIPLFMPRSRRCNLKSEEINTRNDRPTKPSKRSKLKSKAKGGGALTFNIEEDEGESDLSPTHKIRPATSAPCALPQGTSVDPPSDMPSERRAERLKAADLF